MSTSAPAIDIRRIAGHIGAELTGIRLAADLPGDVFAAIRQALLEHKVIFFRGQDHLSDAEQAGGGVGGKSSRDEQHHREVFLSTIFQTEHPVVRVHPETGERALLLGQFVRRIVGVSASDSRYLFELFQRHVTRLENTVRWRWAPGDLAIWDNRATQHYAIDDYGDLPRQMHRITVAGDVPLGVDGRRSTALRGESAPYLTTA